MAAGLCASLSRMTNTRLTVYRNTRLPATSSIGSPGVRYASWRRTERFHIAGSRDGLWPATTTLFLYPGQPDAAYQPPSCSCHAALTVPSFQEMASLTGCKSFHNPIEGRRSFVGGPSEGSNTL